MTSAAPPSYQPTRTILCLPWLPFCVSLILFHRQRRHLLSHPHHFFGALLVVSSTSMRIRHLLLLLLILLFWTFLWWSFVLCRNQPKQPFVDLSPLVCHAQLTLSFNSIQNLIRPHRWILLSCWLCWRCLPSIYISIYYESSSLPFNLNLLTALSCVMFGKIENNFIILYNALGRVPALLLRIFSLHNFAKFPAFWHVPLL